MAIQVLPIIKALAPVISTAGSMYSEWQRHKRGQAGGDEEGAGPDLERLRALEAASAENSHLIAQLAEQVRATAVEVEQLARTAEAETARLRRWLGVATAIAIVSAVIALAALANG